MVVLRSEALRRGTLILPAEKSRAFVDAIGQSVEIQFEDMNIDHGRRPFKRVSGRLEEIDRKLRVIYDRLSLSDRPAISDSAISGFLASKHKIEKSESEVDRLFATLNDLKLNNDEISTDLTLAIQERAVLSLALTTLTTASPSLGTLGAAEGRLARESLLQVSAIAGVVAKQDEERLKRTVFRAARGNVLIFSDDLVNTPLLGTMGPESAGAKESVYVCYFQGGDQTSMREKIIRVCQGFGASLVAWPESQIEAGERLAKVERQINEKTQVLAKFREFEKAQIAEYLQIGESGLSRLEELKFFVIKEKNLYETLNMFSGDRFILRCDCWFPEAAVDKIQGLIEAVGSEVGAKGSLLLDKPVNLGELNFSGHEHEGMPPTYIKRNEFTSVFQDLVDTYGVPRYEEVNPALFTVVSFPFIFGVMYGDVGHGSMLLVFGIFLVMKAEGVKKGDYGGMLQTMASVRYLIFMMGLFAVFAGFMYNDVLSLGMRIWDSRYTIEEDGAGRPVDWFNHRNNEEGENNYGPYPFGLDPAWHGAQNELLYVNSFKMKLSVVLGVAQMVLGVLLKFVNAWHFRSTVDFVCECIPQLVFMLAIFGYMDWMIMYKWTHAVDDDPALNGAPSIINTLINMGLGQTEKLPLYVTQGAVQTRLLSLALWAVPIMLIPKPVVLWWNHRKTQAAGHGGTADYQPLQTLEEGSVKKGEEEEHGGFQLGEVVIHQIIETIEYVLGTVSHASSYLRQWALSLAHQQLSLVFFGKILAPALTAGFLINAFYIYIAFAIFMGVTAGVLLGMDVLECFLHTLRLHWVEFQSKFYKADGKAFAPFSHKGALLNAIANQ